MDDEDGRRVDRYINFMRCADVFSKRVLEILRNLLVVGVLVALSESTDSIAIKALALISVLAWMFFLVAGPMAWLMERGNAAKRTRAVLWIAIALLFALLIMAYFTDEIADILLQVIKLAGQKRD